MTKEIEFITPKYHNIVSCHKKKVAKSFSLEENILKNVCQLQEFIGIFMI